MYKNWPEICKIDDFYLRLCISFSRDEETLRVLHRGAPHLFVSSEMPRVKLSQLRAYALERVLETEQGRETTREMALHWADRGLVQFGACEHFHVPVFDDADVRFSHDNPVYLSYTKVHEIWRGIQLIIVDQHALSVSGYLNVTVAPAECIEVDC
ncbi:MAG: hypothetical protein U1A16_04095 [Patescibacteria group bacterium]|nr:hypothetical protein [Patescibacteria group bacterium]